MLNLISKKLKGVSPLITVVLLIIVSVVIVNILLNWGKSFTTNVTTKVNTFAEYKTLDGFIIVKKAMNNKLLLYNDHSTIDTTIIGYKIRTDNDDFKDYGFLNTLIILDNNITFNKKTQIELDLICFPENKFYLDLMTSDNKYIPLSISTDKPTNNSCLDYGLVAHWDFKDLGTLKLTDKTNRGNDCDLIDTTINEFWSKGNGIGYFDGSCFANCGKQEDFNAENFTLSIWVKPYYLSDFPDFSATGYGLAGAAQWHESGQFIGLHHSGFFKFAVHDLDSGEFQTSSSSYSEDTWINLILTYDGTTGRGYVNSELKTSLINDYILPKEPFYIGDVYQGGWEKFIGEISDVRFYNRALSNSEVEDFYNISSIKYT